MNNRCRVMLVLIAGWGLIACGRSENAPRQSGSAGYWTTVPNALQGPEETTYIPPVINDVMVVDLSRFDNKNPISIPQSTTIVFQNPPQDTGTALWIVDYNDQEVTKLINGVEQPYKKDFVEEYPLQGWTFKLKKVSKTKISFTNVHQDLTALYQNVYHFEMTP